MTASFSGKPAPHSASSPILPEDAALEFLKRLKTPSRLLVAYSGGGDSTGLLVALAEALSANPGLPITLVAATVDHGLRSGSDEEARAAGELCAILSVPHHILTWTGEKPRTGIQAAAREARYRLLGELALSEGVDLIVTAHNRDDQIETVAMRRARNADAPGGMSEAVLYDRRIWILRPFLDVGRAAIRDYLRQRGIGWVDDPSNDNEMFERVRLRKSALAEGATSGNAARRALSVAAAQFLLDHAVIHSSRVAVLDLSRFEVGNPAHGEALRQLAAMMGGRTHPAGAEVMDRILHFIETAGHGRLTAGRVVFDRRRHLLYLTRERRSLPDIEILPGSSAVWDNRFRIHNDAAESAFVGARGDTERGTKLISADLPDDLPGAVRKCIASTEPMLRRGNEKMLTTKPIIAQFERFLPLDVLAVGNALAFLAGLDHFPGLPTR